MIDQMIQKWQGFLDPITKPASVRWKEENPMRHGTYMLDEVDSAPVSVIRGFIVKMVNLLLAQQRDFRDSLS